MANIWRLYTTTIPSISGYEVNRGYIINNTLVLNNISGGRQVSKIASTDDGSIFYVETAAISGYITNGIFNPTIVAGDYIVTENGDYIVTENGDRLII